MKISKFAMFYLIVLFILALGCVSSSQLDIDQKPETLKTKGPETVEPSVSYYEVERFYLIEFNENLFQCLTINALGKGYILDGKYPESLNFSKKQLIQEYTGTPVTYLEKKYIKIHRLFDTSAQISFFSEAILEGLPFPQVFYSQSDLTKDVEDLIASCSTVISQKPANVYKKVRQVVSQGLEAGYSESKKSHMERLAK